MQMTRQTLTGIARMAFGLKQPESHLQTMSDDALDEARDTNARVMSVGMVAGLAGTAAALCCGLTGHVPVAVATAFMAAACAGRFTLGLQREKAYVAEESRRTEEIHQNILEERERALAAQDRLRHGVQGGSSSRTVSYVLPRRKGMRIVGTSEDGKVVHLRPARPFTPSGL